MSRVVVLGASGAIGCTVVEELLALGDFEVVAQYRSPGNAWRLLQADVERRQVDLLDRGSVDELLNGCEYVINCARGDDALMIDGLKNSLGAAGQASVKGFVHLSSIMVFGDPPRVLTESDPRSNPLNEYGALKLKQDELVEAAAASGLPAVILVPPNVSGVYSSYWLALVNTLNSGRFALVEKAAPCVLVDGMNLAHACVRALACGTEKARRYFITDGEPLTWHQLIGDLQTLVVTGATPRTLNRETLANLAVPPPVPRSSILKSLKHVISSDVREALRKDPMIEKFDVGVRSAVGRIGGGFEQSLRRNLGGAAEIQYRHANNDIDITLSAHQLRDVVPSIQRARTDLGYRPAISYQQSMAAFQRWYRHHHLLDTEFADLAGPLHF
ncbi:MAG: NAD-dependent epimerase/dehydratase family protein [Pseudomonadota bacterium]